MSKKKSLGSSPVGFQSDNGAMNFISDLGVRNTERAVSKSTSSNNNSKKNGQSGDAGKSDEKETSEKKIVSYNLEKDLVSRVKMVADKKGMYYSTLVNNALELWLAENS